MTCPTTTTRRMPNVTTRDVIGSVRNRLACLALKRINQTATDADRKEEAELQRKLSRLEREQITEKVQR